MRRLIAFVAALALLPPAAVAAGGNSHQVCEIVKLCNLQTPKSSSYGHDRFYRASGRSRGGVLLVHGGAFYLTLKQAWSTGGPHAAFTRRHFDVLVVDYPVVRVSAEVRYVSHAARRLRLYERARHLPAYAYGESSGGDLVGLLAVHHQVAAATTNAPEGDLLSWPVDRPGYDQLPGFCQNKVPLSLGLRHLFSPTLQVHGTAAPRFVEASHGDTITPFSQAAALARAAHGTLVVLTGNHLADPTGASRAAQWLATKGWLAPRPKVSGRSSATGN